MPSTAIRPDYTVTFRDVDGALLYQTGDAARVYLTKLDEGAAEVKSITVDVPARDGALDLTESVAGRPLYGNRAIKMTLSIVRDDHPAAVGAVRDLRRAVHGVMCRVETPDNLLPGNPPEQGWWLGRVSVDKVSYPGEAAVVELSVDAQPWIYFGTGTVTLEAGASSTDDWGIIPSWHRDRINDALVTIRQAEGIWYKTSNYAYAGRVPSDIALVLSRSPNLLEYGTMCRWQEWSIDSTATGADWDASWVRVPGDFDRTVIVDSGDTEATRAYRWMLTSTAGGDGVERGIMVTGYHDVFRLHITFDIVDDAPGTVLGLGSAVSLVMQGSRRPDGPADAAGGVLQNGQPVARQTLWDTSSGQQSVSTYIDIDPADFVPGTAGVSELPAGYITFGIEARWVSLDITNMSVELIDPDMASMLQQDFEADNAVMLIAAPAPLYSSGQNFNTVHAAPYGAWMDAPLAVPAGSDTAAVVTPPDVYQMQMPQIPVSASNIRAYGVTNRGWMQLYASLTFWEWGTAEFDAGDMPTLFSLDTADPVVFDLDGSRFNMTGDGTLPVQLGGEVELGYMVMGSTDGTITYEKGTV